MSKQRRKKLYQNPLRYEPGYDSLAEEIVWRAAIDYEIALKRGPRKYKTKPGRGSREEIEDFFRSPWYRKLTGIDGDWLMEEVQSVCQESMSQWEKEETVSKEEAESKWEKNKVRFIYRQLQDDENLGKQNGKF